MIRILMLATLLWTTSASAATWVEWTPAAGPAPGVRTLAGGAYDTIGNRLIVFGGQPAAGAYDDIWAFDFDTGGWEDLTPVIGPLPEIRLTPVVVFDPVHNRILTWSGQGAALFNDTWAFDLETNAWEQIEPPAPLPAERYGAAGVLDPRTGELVTFGGFQNGASRFEDTWRFDADAAAWSLMTPAARPTRRCRHSASYDSRGHRMIMYGGQRSGALDDVWFYDLTSDTWTDATPEARPDGRWHPAQSYDSTRDRALVFGGNRGGGALTDELWAFQLATATWAEVPPQGSGPSARDGAVAAYDIQADRLIVFGGFDGAYRNDIWSVEFGDPAGVPFPDDVIADGDGEFAWPVPANVDWVQGDLDNIATLTVARNGSIDQAARLLDDANPESGVGWYYLFRLRGDAGSWQTAPGDQPERDVLLP